MKYIGLKITVCPESSNVLPSQFSVAAIKDKGMEVILVRPRAAAKDLNNKARCNSIGATPSKVAADCNEEGPFHWSEIIALAPFNTLV